MASRSIIPPYMATALEGHYARLASQGNVPSAAALIQQRVSNELMREIAAQGQRLARDKENLIKKKALTSSSDDTVKAESQQPLQEKGKADGISTSNSSEQETPEPPLLKSRL